MKEKNVRKVTNFFGDIESTQRGEMFKDDV